MKNYSVVLFLLLLSFLVNAQNNQTGKTITVGAVHYPPYYDFLSDNNSDKVRPSGFLAAHVEKSLEKHGFTVKWQRIPLARGERALKKGIIQVYGSFAPGPGDKADVVYSPNRLIRMQPVVCGFKKGLYNEKVVTDADIKGSEVLYPRGAFIHPKLTALKMKIQRLDYSGDYITRAMKMIKKGRAQYFILPESFRVRPYLKKHSHLQCSNFIDPIAMHLSFAPKSPWKDIIVPLIKEYPAQISIDNN